MGRILWGVICSMPSEMELSQQEVSRYARHFALPGFGLEGQKKLKSTKVLVVGAGGLGCPMIQYLAAAGVGKLGIVDFDVVDASNLHRQVLYSIEDIGKSKAEEAAACVARINPHVQTQVYKVALDSSNALEIIADYDIVADGTDNFPTRYLVNDACVLAGKINVWAAIFRFDGQVSVFNYPLEDGSRGPNYRDLFPEPPPPGSVPNCAEGGVLGVLPGLLGSLQAAEVIKVAAGLGQVLAGRLMVLDTLTGTSRTLSFDPDPDAEPITKLIDYEQFCGVVSGDAGNSDEIAAQSNSSTAMKELTVQEYKALRDSGEDHVLIDVREPYEVEITEMGGQNIPLAQIMGAADSIPRDKKVVLHCRSGKRSGNAVKALEAQHGFENLYNLAGGILAWGAEIDSSITQY